MPSLKNKWDDDDDDDYDFDGDDDGFVARYPGGRGHEIVTKRPEEWSCSEWRCMP